MEMSSIINVGLTAAIGGLGWWLKAQHSGRKTRSFDGTVTCFAPLYS
jgi:hypothetical protein